MRCKKLRSDGRDLILCLLSFAGRELASLMVSHVVKQGRLTRTFKSSFIPPGHRG